MLIAAYTGKWHEAQVREAMAQKPDFPCECHATVFADQLGFLVPLEMIKHGSVFAETALTLGTWVALWVVHVSQYVSLTPLHGSKNTLA